jgi:hypothetical protein
MQQRIQFLSFGEDVGHEYREENQNDEITDKKSAEDSF